MIEVKGISKSFKEVRAVDDVSLTFRSGEYAAVLGPNGAGKTTLVEIIEGIRRPDSGEVVVEGMHWARHEKKLRRMMGISLQETKFIDKLTVSEILRLFSGFYGHDGSGIGRILNLVGLEEKSSSYTMNLSGGQRQKLALGIALINDPGILILDEPTTGLDPNARREIWAILEGLRPKGVLLILTTHYMEEAEHLCDRIVFMDRGRIIADGTLDELLERHRAREILSFTVEAGGGEAPHAEETSRRSGSEESAAQRAPAAAPYMPGVESVPGAIEVVPEGSPGSGVLYVEDIVPALPPFLDLVKSSGMTLRRLECRKMNLEDLFISLTGRRLDA